MPGTVIGKTLNLGYAGKISRNPGNLISARAVKSILNGSGVETLQTIGFGDPVVLNTDNTYSRFGDSGTGVSAATAANFAGVAVAEVKQMTTYATNAAGSYLPNQACDVIQIGSVTVVCSEGTPAAGGAVYIVTVAGTTSPVGAYVATATPAGAGATAVQITNAQWTTGKVDANGIAEITLLTRNKAQEDK